MGVTNKKTLINWIVFLVSVLILAGGLLYFVYFFTPKNSLELHQELHFADSFKEVQKLVLKGYEDNFTEEDFDYIQNNSADRISQFTLIEYNEKSYVVMTSPGTKRLNILAVEELPNDIRNFFLESSK